MNSPTGSATISSTRFPAMWEFHKVHHSAEVLTPLTELRQHPVEIIVMVNLIGLCTGVTFGVMTYVFGPGVRPFTLLNGNILIMTFLLTYGHLRHSQHVDRVHRNRRPDPAESRPSPAASLRQSRSFRQELRLCARPLGLGVRHARDSRQDARTASFSASATRRRRSARRFPPSPRPARALPAMR